MNSLLSVRRFRPSLNAVLLIVSLIAGAYLMAVAITVPRFPWLGWITLFPVFTAIYVFGTRTVCAGGPALRARQRGSQASRQQGRNRQEGKEARRQQGHKARTQRAQGLDPANSDDRSGVDARPPAPDPRALFLRAVAPPRAGAFPLHHSAFSIHHSSVALRASLFALLSGALWGASLYVFLTLWGHAALVTNGYEPLILLVLLPALFTLGGVWLTHWIGFSPFVLAFGWLGVELALTPLGLRHGLLAETQTNLALFPAVGHLLGYVLVAFTVAYVSAWLVSTAGRLAGIVIKQSRRLFSGGIQLRTLLPQAATPTWSSIHSCVAPRAPPEPSSLRRFSLMKVAGHSGPEAECCLRPESA